jgi:hypothetical protein
VPHATATFAWANRLMQARGEGRPLDADPA